MNKQTKDLLAIGALAFSTAGAIFTARDIFNLIPSISTGWIWMLFAAIATISIFHLLRSFLFWCAEKAQDIAEHIDNNEFKPDMPGHEAVNYLVYEARIRDSLGDDPLKHGIAILIDALKLGRLRASRLVGSQLEILTKEDFQTVSTEYRSVSRYGIHSPHKELEALRVNCGESKISAIYVDSRDVRKLWETMAD